MKMLRIKYKYYRWASAAVLLASVCMITVYCPITLSQEEDPVAPSEELGGAPPSESPRGEAVGQPETTPFQPVEEPEGTSPESEQQDAGDEGTLEPKEQPSASEDDGRGGLQHLWPEGKTEPESGSLAKEATPESEPGFLALGGEGVTPEFDVIDSVKKMSIALLLAVAMFCIAVWLYKRLTRGTPLFPDQKVGRVISKIYLNPKAVLYLVKVADRILVIGTNPATISLITEIADPDLVKEIEQKQPEAAAARAPFAGYLRQFRGRFSGVQQAGEEDAKLEEHLRDIKDQMARLKTLIGGSDEEER
jgi:flagellar biogenesis protein FliO